MITPPVVGILDNLKNFLSFSGMRRVIRALGNRTIFFTSERARREAEAVKAGGEALKQIAEARAVELQNVGAALALLRETGASQAELKAIATERVERLLEMAHDVQVISRYEQMGAFTEIRALPEGGPAKGREGVSSHGEPIEVVEAVIDDSQSLKALVSGVYKGKPVVIVGRSPAPDTPPPMEDDPPSGSENPPVPPSGER